MAKRPAEATRVILLMLIIAATTPPLGCDIYYGVSRSAKLAQPIDISCVPKALEQVPGVTSVEHHHLEPNTCSWPHATDTIDQFVFAGDKIWGVAEVSVAYDQTARLAMYHRQINRKPPQDVIDGTREAMDAAEVLVKRECKGLRLVSEMKESCHGVLCPSPIAAR
jgi:hypothetical protein